MGTNLNTVYIGKNRFHGSMSPVLDGGGSKATWHRLRLNPGSSRPVTVILYASHEKRFICGGEIADIDKLQSMPDYRLEAVLRHCRVGAVTGCGDILLSAVRKRYFWFDVRHDAETCVESAEISFPAQSPLRYLPEVYQTGEEAAFTERYLSIFQSLYDDLEEKIDKSSVLMDAEKCPERFVPWLARLLGLSDISLWPESARRRYVQAFSKARPVRGTVSGLRGLLSLYCPGQYFIVEGWRVLRFSDSPEWPVISRIYPTDRFSFLVLAAAKSAKMREEALRQLLRRHKPAHTTASLRVLEGRTVLDSDGYLGINTVLSGVCAARLDAAEPLNSIMLGG